MAAVVGIAFLACCMMSSVGGYYWVRSDEEAILAERQAKKEKEDRLENLLANLGDVPSIKAHTITIENSQPLNIQEVLVYDKMENNMANTEMMTGSYAESKVSFDLGAMTEIPGGIVIVNNLNNGGVVGATITLLDETGTVVHKSKEIKDVADAYEYDANFKTWQKLSFVKVGRNEDGTKIS
ncbi:hypothetical protein DSLPV1_136 [Dishui lake phycodnavirus 1]|uniref:hypothetical protein n=1 Tax=Dishui lake phycodnavirus 1 TaxID=2079134 RepID=UPI000CD6A9AF|nr:hypothetical protein C5Y57_gp136 [Dishui lake phycodnavirus 1]AUT19107.1 hypothetical protein DSLPV1_136 [Dishui lake phycodnavirus 1]